jgi:hypothetical protein
MQSRRYNARALPHAPKDEGQPMEFFVAWWPIIAAGVGGLFWLSRLEWRGLQNEAEIKRLWTQRKEDLASAQKARDETNEILREMQRDIKQLLQNVGK